MTAYRKDFDETKYISFLIKDNELLGKHKEIWEKVKNSLKKEFDSESIYNEKQLKFKIKSYNRKINTNFCNNKIPKEGPQCICLSVILLDSVFRTGKNYYPQVFLEECKNCDYEEKSDEKTLEKVQKEKNSEKENSDEENYIKEN